MSNENLKLLDDLIDQYFAGVIEEADFDRLQELLRGDSEARLRFRELTQVHAALHEIVDGGGVENVEAFDPVALPAPVAQHAPAAQPSQGIWSAWIALTVLLTTAALLLVSGMLGKQPVVTDAPERPLETSVIETRYEKDDALIPTPIFVNSRKDDSVAVLQSAVAVEWGGRFDELRVGDLISTGAIELDAGIAEFVFLNGAVLVLEGPTRLELLTQSHCLLHSGKLRCFVPDSATGFKIQTRRSQYVDQGTEFALSVDASSEELHVFDGKVDVRPSVGTVDASVVGEGSGLRHHEGELGRWTPIQSEPDQFADSGSIRDRKRQQEQDQHLRWREHLRELASRDDVVALFDFEPEPRMPQVLRNLVPSGEHGSIVGGQWTSGRWLGKKSIDFKRPNDRIRISKIGEFQNLTMSVWLRLDGFDREFHSILLTDRFEDGEIHWQIKSTGNIDVGIKQHPEKRQRIVVTPRLLGYEDLGCWRHLVVVVDQSSNRVANFIDGDLVLEAAFWESGSNPPRDPITLRLGACELGNWSPRRDYDNWLLRGFNGRMDEFVVFNRALSDDEVRSLFDAGSTE